MSQAEPTQVVFPFNPLASVQNDMEYRRRVVSGILESYHGNYDILMEAVQNSVDAVEDACLLGLLEPHKIEITINLVENWMAVLDTGTGMAREVVAAAFAPNASFKSDPTVVRARGTHHPYRGYKGVGLTFLAYGTDSITLHSKKDAVLTKAKLDYGRAWAMGETAEMPMIVEDIAPSPLANEARGTYVKVVFSDKTRPKSLARLVPDPNAWAVVLRTKTALGQITGTEPAIQSPVVTLKVIRTDGTENVETVLPLFLYPHMVAKTPPFRFLNLNNYYENHPEQAAVAPDDKRRDGIYTKWNSERINRELTEQQRTEFRQEIIQYKPRAYAFLPYQASLWGTLNETVAGTRQRSYLQPGLIIGVNKQRLADTFDIEASRFETMSRNVMVVVHFDNARPDQGRKTLQDELTTLARKIADRAVQYLAKQRDFLKPAGEAPNPNQRQVELNHQDWIFNVKQHQINNRLLIPPISLISTPQAEQDVVGLFHQLAALESV